MSAQIPYHLRTNKNVERTLFIDLLRILAKALPGSTHAYRYVGLGGPMMEDFSSIQNVWGNRTMTSLEEFPHVVTRQEFNKPNCRTKVTCQTTGQFAADYETGNSPLLVWFDYTAPKWLEQITESCELLKKLPDFSLFKISLACKISAWNNIAGGTSNKFENRLAHLQRDFAAHGPFGVDDVRDHNFPETLYRVFQSAVAEAIPDRIGRVCRPLCSFTYSDGTPMLTATVIVGPFSNVQEVIKKSGISHWEYSRLRWGRPTEISIPELSIRERLAVEKLLPDYSARRILRRLKISFDSHPARSNAILSRYVHFAQHVPYFAKVRH